MAGAEIELVDIWKSYAGESALRGVNIAIDRGAITVLLGPSGCGKTTLLKIIAGLIEPDRGKVLFDGADYTRVPAEKRGVGVVFQDLALFPHMNVYDNVAFGLRMRGERDSEISQKVKRALELVGLEPARFSRKRVDELSGGEQQRVAIARALVIEPRVLLLDEPLAHVDYKIKQRLLTEIRRIQRHLGITMVYVTHDQSEAMSVADKVAIMERGTILQHGNPREVYERPKSLAVATFFGDANVMSSELAGLEGSEEIAIRPEDVLIEPPPGVDVVREGTVEDLIFQGPLIRVDVRVDGMIIKAVISKRELNGLRLSPGKRVRVGWRLSDLMVGSK